MSTKQKTIIVTGASQGIGAAIANLFLDRGYNVVGNSRRISQVTGEVLHVDGGAHLGRW
jgi:NAD(P)-dependent dehydrogenase (short-subunit alcohol dehydrogenase family)